MAEYKIVGYKWDSARQLQTVFNNDQTVKKFEASAAAEDLNSYAREGWRVVNCWRTDSGLTWFVLER